MMLLACLFLPVIGGVLVVLTGRWPNIRETVSILTGIALFALVLQLPTALPVTVLAEPAPGFQLALHIEPLGYVFACLASFLWIVTTVYAIGYMRGHHEKNQTRFYFWFAVAIAATMGVAFSGDMLTLFVFYEILTLATWPLVTHSQTKEARRSGRIYLGILLSTSMGLLLLSIGLIWWLTGSLEFRPGGVFDGTIAAPVLAIIYALFVFGVGKAALMPFHGWLPAAMVAPTPVSALLHAVAVVKAGVFTIIKGTFYLFGLDNLSVSGANEYLLPVAVITIILASLIAMQQDNLKARLAYSTVSQLSYVVLGALLANVIGVIAAAVHLVMHAFAKITLFFCAGAIMVASHKTEISDMRGLGRRMPYTMGAFIIGALGIIGLPPLGAIWSKWYLTLGVIENQYWSIIGVIVVSTLLNIAYLLPIPIRGFMDGDEQEGSKGISEAPLACLLAIGITSVGCVALFFYAPQLVEFLEGGFKR